MNEETKDIDWDSIETNILGVSYGADDTAVYVRVTDGSVEFREVRFEFPSPQAAYTFAKTTVECAGGKL